MRSLVHVALMFFGMLGIPSLHAENDPVIRLEVIWNRGDDPSKVLTAGYESGQRHSPSAADEVHRIAAWKLPMIPNKENANPTMKGGVNLWAYPNPNDLKCVTQADLYKLGLHEGVMLRWNWPTSRPLSITVAGVTRQLSCPEENRILFVDFQGVPEKGVLVTVFYDSSKRKEEYRTDASGMVHLETSALHKAKGIRATFDGGPEIYLYGKSDWNAGLIVTRPALQGANR
jgi:hypothetical protein